MENFIAMLLQDFEQGKMSRRQLVRTLTLTAAVGSAGSAYAAEQAPGYVATATHINHVSYPCKDYRKLRDFYAGLFGMKVSEDSGVECRLTFGNNILAIRNENPKNNQFAGKIDHIALSIANWDTDPTVRPKIEAELKRRGLKLPTVTAAENVAGFRATERAFHVADPEGLRVQMGGLNQ